MKKETKILVGKIILATIASAEVLAVAAVAPNALQMVDLFYDRKKRRYSMGAYMNKSLQKLKDRGFIKFEKTDGKSFVRLTDKGERELLKYRLREAVIKKPARWDGKWRVLIFDIKERRRLSRDGLRQELTNLGFKKLQNSVWAFPYECEEIMIMLKSYFRLGKDVLYMVVERVENDRWLKEEFGLK